MLPEDIPDPGKIPAGAGVVHEGVDPSEPVAGFADQRAYAPGAGNVGVDPQGSGAVPADCRKYGIRLREFRTGLPGILRGNAAGSREPACDHHGGPFRRKAQGDLPAEIADPSGDHDDFSAHGTGCFGRLLRQAGDAVLLVREEGGTRNLFPLLGEPKDRCSRLRRRRDLVPAVRPPGEDQADVDFAHARGG